MRVLILSDIDTPNPAMGAGFGVSSVAVKKGLSRYSARQIPPVRARAMIESGAKHTLQNLERAPIYAPARPTTITIEVDSVEKVGQFRGRAGVKVVAPLKVESKGDSWLEAWDRVWPQADL